MKSSLYGSGSHLSVSAQAADDLLYQTERTVVFRVARADGTGHLICKQPIGPKAATRLRHERRILERLSGVKGVVQPCDKNSSAKLIAFDDGDFVSLAEAIQGKLPDIPALLALVLQLADIIAAVHRAGVVHKDISPANILLDAEQKPWLIDFDLATTFAEERPGFLQPQDIAGTLAYIAPEQTGRTGRSVDQRADLYALGAVCYELAVGHPPFEDKQGDSLQLIHDILTRAPTPPAEMDMRIPAALSEILLRLLEKEPDRRYQSAEGLKIDLLRLREMQVRGENGTFQLGDHDFPPRLLPPSQLVGREKEIGILQTAFDNALRGRDNSLLISGAPGVGKSALINELRPIVTGRRGWFIAGKYDQYRQGVAADALGQVLQALIRLMMAEPEAELVKLRERILDSLGVNAGLLAAALPEFAALFGITPDVASGDPIQIAKRIIQAGKDLLRAVASPQRPLVMVIDDLQWATASSLDFIDGIVTDDRMRGLLLVGSYRENEVDAIHPLTAMLSRWERLDVAPLQLRLNNLPPGDLATLLAEMLRIAPEPAARLAEAAGARTGGNPFDTVELVNALRHDGALILGEAGWQWDAATIRRYVGKGEVIDLLVVRIARLPAEARSLLECMACMGGDVELDQLAAASGLSTARLEEHLSSSLEDGLLVIEETSNTVRFRHDRVQQAAYHRLNSAARSVLHLTLARRLAARPEFAATATEQYLPAIDEIEDNEERRQVVGLLHATATQARHAANYVLAERFLTAALALLDKVRQSGGIQQDDKPLLIALEIAQHSVLYSLGRLEEADDIFRSLERQCPAALNLVDAACTQIASLTNRNRLNDAIALGLDLLQQFGLNKPSDMGAVIADRFDGLPAWAMTLQQADDLGRAEIEDPRVLGMARLFQQVMVPSYLCDPTLCIWLVLESQRLWVEHGPCAPLVSCMIPAPPLLIGMRQDYRAAGALAQHAIAVGEARGYKVETATMRWLFATIVNHWFEMLESSIDQAQTAREGLLQAGDFQYACMTYLTLIPMQFECASTLVDCIEETKAGLELAARTGNDNQAATFLPFCMLLNTLQGTAVIGGPGNDDFNEEAFHAMGDVGLTASGYFHIVSALSAALFGIERDLVRHAAAAMPLLAGMPGNYLTALAHLLQALSLATRMKEAPADQRAALQLEFDICRDWLAARAADAPMNFLHLQKWIDAERAWALNDFQGTATGFDSALQAVALRQRPWHKALISERAGLFHLKHGLEHTGHMLLNEAQHLYEAWGASTKVEDMARRYNFLRGGSGSGQHRKSDSRHSSRGSISTDSLDLIGIVRASQALSSETSLVRLRVRMAELLRELTGATQIQGALWYEDLQEWRVTTEGAAADSPIPVEEGGQQGLLPLSAFNYVVRTREPLLVDDALKDDRFRHDPYFAGIECCSLLGVPVFNQGVMRIVLLLENRLSRGAFSADRLEAVNLIAGQLAISIDNALLYDSLERKVMERTRALEEANQRLASLSITDALTGLANRRRFNEVFEAEWHRAIRPRQWLGLAIFDIDNFKDYNDHYGHQGGDECLRRVADALASSVRGDADLMARYGGEEFVIVLPGADTAAALAVAERARVIVESLRLPHEKAASGIVTVSAGVAATVPTPILSSATFVEVADMALYRAKKSGRNRVEQQRGDETEGNAD